MYLLDIDVDTFRFPALIYTYPAFSISSCLRPNPPVRPHLSSPQAFASTSMSSSTRNGDLSGKSMAGSMKGDMRDSTDYGNCVVRILVLNRADNLGARPIPISAKKADITDTD